MRGLVLNAIWRKQPIELERGFGRQFDTIRRRVSSHIPFGGGYLSVRRSRFMEGPSDCSIKSNSCAVGANRQDIMKSSARAVVIGASAGGVETLKEVVRELPSDFPAPVFIVLHIAPLPIKLASGNPESIRPHGSASS